MAGAGGNAANPRNDHRTIPGNIAMELSIEEKEKGPKKRDILNGVVSWDRDLIGVLHVKYQQEAELAELIRSLGGTWPFEQCEEEKRMRSEILGAFEKNDPTYFSYTRGPDSGLRVPKHTNIAGDAVQGGDMSGLTPPSLSPSHRSSASSAQDAGQSQHWKNADHAA
ncbi:hypothetical protein MYU51_018367 [Penicillium brevicompactum]